MAISTYTELKTSIANFLNRDDLTATIPDFISLAESSINNEIRHWRMETRAETTGDRPVHRHTHRLAIDYPLSPG